MRLMGVFGGTFDPIHNGHVAVVNECADRLGLERVMVIPAGRPPHRVPPVASPEDRMAMVRLALDGSYRLVASDIEVGREGPSYSVQTLRGLKVVFAEHLLVLLLGWDAALEFGTWQDAGEIGDLAKVAVFNRAGSPPVTAAEIEKAGLPAGTWPVTVDSPPIKGADIRRRLRAGGDVSADVPPSVLAYIDERGLYRD
ncbi:MAG: nicotinate-nucleotide adenylyltransferase [Chloroflexota bacterium]|jgi:nicotinate-nucleotide adenylyltransferase|nr:nicotinate-nucleotide adenylyltransferase [Chloroflexota bacterium]